MPEEKSEHYRFFPALQADFLGITTDETGLLLLRTVFEELNIKASFLLLRNSHRHFFRKIDIEACLKFHFIPFTMLQLHYCKEDKTLASGFIVNAWKDKQSLGGFSEALLLDFALFSDFQYSRLLCLQCPEDFDVQRKSNLTLHYLKKVLQKPP